MLTDTKLQSLKPRPSSFRVADTDGLCIEIRPNGSKVWRYRYLDRPVLFSTAMLDANCSIHPIFRRDMELRKRSTQPLGEGLECILLNNQCALADLINKVDAIGRLLSR